MNNNKAKFLLHRDSFGRLVFTGADGKMQEGVVPVRAFPITSPDRGISLIDPHGHELSWIDQSSDLPDELRKLIEADLASRELVPRSSIFVAYQVLLRHASGKWRPTGGRQHLLSRERKIFAAWPLPLC